MDPTITTALIGAVATIVAALIGAQAVRRKEQRNKELTEELEQLRRSGYRVPMLSPEEYGIDIVSPADYAQVDKSFDVSGTYRALPPGQRIWVSTFSVDKDGNVSEYWPQGAAKAADRKWYGRVHNIGGKAGETKEFLVLAVGQDGDTLFRHYGKVGMVTGNWTSISHLTSDIVLCKKGIVRISS